MVEKVKHILTSDEKVAHWGYGEWVEEPDQVKWEYKGIQCKILRSYIWEGVKKSRLSMGSLCGYIIVPEKHPWNFKDQDLIKADVHGGISFASETEDGEWWIGFDCAHSDDLVPSFERLTQTDPILCRIQMAIEELKKTCPDSLVWVQTYKNISFCKSECERLVDQLLEEKDNWDIICNQLT